MSFKDWWRRGFGPYLVGVIPHDAKIAPGSDVSEVNRGKVPGHLRKDGWVGLGGKFIDRPPTTQAEAKKWLKDGAGVGLFSQYVPGLDIDVNHEEVARFIQDLAFEHLGDAPVRWRKGSSRRLLPYRCKAGDLRKRRVAFMINGEVQAVELLGRGNYYNVDGIHPSGEPYRWSDDKFKIGDLVEIDTKKLNTFFTAVVEYLELMGYETVRSTGESSSTGTRKSLDNKALHAPSPEDVLAILKVVPCDADTFPERDDFVRVLPAIKAALGPDRDEHWPDVLGWALNYPGAEDEYITKIWESIKDAELGWSFLLAWAQSRGYGAIQAQKDFDEGVDDNTEHALKQLPDDHPAKETALDRMLEEIVYVKDQGEYYNVKNGSSLNSRGLNATYTSVAEFGLSGPRSAEGIFQNHKAARKVDTLTSRPGGDPIVKERNECGVEVEAVNVWRPSSRKPKKDATDEDVAPWLDLVWKAFGQPGAAELDHFLNYCAFLLQCPGVKIGHAVVLIGGQGTGKDTLLKPIFEAIGQHNVAPIDTNALFGTFNFYLRNAVVYVQEIMTGGRRDMYNYIKPFVSGQSTRLAVNEKNRRQYFVPNNQNWIITSNHDHAINLEDDDRRFWVHRMLMDEPPSDEYFAKLHRWLDNGGIEKVFGWLLRRDISGFNPMARPPMTAAKTAMLELSQPAPVRWLRKLFNPADDGVLAGRSVITVAEVRRAEDQDFRAPDGINNNSITKALKVEGFETVYRGRIGGGDPVVLWARGDAKKLDVDKLRERYIAETNAPAKRTAATQQAEESANAAA